MTRGAYLTVCLSLVLLSVGVGVVLVHARAQNPDLRPSTLYSGKLTSKTATFRFRVESDQYFTLELENPANDVALSLSTSRGRPGRSFGCFHQRRPVISEVSGNDGEYTVELHPCGNDLTGFFFGLRLSQPRRATERDMARIAAERAEEESDHLVNELQSSRLATQRYEEALRNWTKARDRIGEFRTLLRAAELAGDIGQTEKSWGYLERAHQIALEVQQATYLAEVLTAMATFHLRTGNATVALENCSRSLEINRSAGDNIGVAEALLVLGDIYYERSELPRAIEANHEAYSLWGRIDNRLGEARSSIALAEIYTDQAEYALATEQANKALSIFQAFGDKRGQIRSRVNIGNTFARMGRKQNALDAYENARSLLQGSDDLFMQALLFGLTARVYADIGDNKLALQYFMVALDNYRRLHHKSGEAAALRQIGEFYFNLGNTRAALANLESATVAYQELSNRRIEAWCLRDIGIVYESLNDPVRATAYFTRSLELNLAEQDKRLQASVLMNLGHIDENQGRYDAAVHNYEQALRLNRDSQDRFGEIQTLYRISSCLRAQGKHGDALRNSEVAIDIIENLRASLASSGLRTSYFASIKEHYDLQIDVLMRVRDTVASAVVRAFELSESSRARALLDSINETRVSISENTDRILVDREVSLRASLDSKAQRYTQILSVDPNSKEVSTLDGEIRKLTAEYDELLGRLRVQIPRYATLVQPQPLKFSEVQKQLLDDDSLLLEYALGEENSYLWAVTPDDFASFVLPKRAEIEQKVRR